MFIDYMKYSPWQNVTVFLYNDAADKEMVLLLLIMTGTTSNFKYLTLFYQPTAVFTIPWHTLWLVTLPGTYWILKVQLPKGKFQQSWDQIPDS